MLLRFLLFLSLLFQTGCATYLVVRGGMVDQDKLQQVKERLISVRGLKFAHEVPIEVLRSDQMKAYIEADLLKDYGDEKLRDMTLAYAKLGLLPKDLDLKKSLLDFYTTQVVAFYDPKQKKLVLPEDMGGGFTVGVVQFLARRDLVGEMVLAHELTHALQDQHFSLGEKVGPSSNEDKVIAFRAVAEGDATLSGFSALMGFTDFERLGGLSKALRSEIEARRSSLTHIPQAILEPLLLQYYGGVSLVSRVLNKRGWLGVDRLYAAPPLSTEQVLHPEKYFDLPDPPTSIELEDLDLLFPSGWKEIESNVLGELLVEVLVKEFLSEEDGKKVAQGWDGDRFVAFRRGEEVSFIWATFWDSVQDAEEFSAQYRLIVSKKYPEGKAAGVIYMERRDRRVIVVEGLEMAHVAAHIERIWQGMRLKEEPFRPPFRPPRKVPVSAPVMGSEAGQ